MNKENKNSTLFMRSVIGYIIPVSCDVNKVPGNYVKDFLQR